MTALLTLLSRLPLGALYVLAYLLYLGLYRVVGLRRHVVVGNLESSFPKLSARAVNDIARRFYRNYADVSVEMIKSLVD